MALPNQRGTLIRTEVGIDPIDPHEAGASAVVGDLYEPHRARYKVTTTFITERGMAFEHEFWISHGTIKAREATDWEMRFAAALRQVERQYLP